MIWFTCLRSCRLGCSHHSAGHGCVAACWAFCAMLELGLLTLQTVSHCHSTHWGGMEKEISCDIINKVILGEICKSIMLKSPERDGIQSKFTNKQINLCENLAHKLEEPEQERLRETKTKEKKWGHDKVSALANSGSIVHSSLLHLSSQGHSARVCSWITPTVCSSHNKWHCSGVHMLSRQDDTSFVAKNSCGTTTLGGFKTGTLTICNLMCSSSVGDPPNPHCSVLDNWQMLTLSHLDYEGGNYSVWKWARFFH